MTDQRSPFAERPSSEQSLWQWPEDDRRAPDPLRQDLEVDVLVAGGGITGLTTALLLAGDRRRVALVEARHFGAGTTGATSAQVTTVPDAGYQALLRRLGADGGREYVSRCAAALELMQHFVDTERIECDWARVPAFQFCERASELDLLRVEQHAAEQLGLLSTLAREVPLPWTTAGALVFPQQARFHPLRYLAGLRRVAAARGVAIHEHTPVTDWDESQRQVIVRTPYAIVRAGALVLATHTPLGVSPVQVELAPMQSYIVALRWTRPFPDALFWDVADPYHYLRPVRVDGRELVLVGGADHKTGRVLPDRHRELVAYAQERLHGAWLERWWSAQFFDPADGLPYIGRAPRAQRTYVATGFAGVGLVQGTMAAMEIAGLLRETVRDDVPWQAARLTIAAASRMVSGGIDAAACWVGDRLAPADGGALESVPSGEGRIMRVDGHRRAVFRDDDGRVHVLSPVCPHLGCLVRWNGSARSWDCPCHGSRFAPTGEVLEGPALSGLTAIEPSQPYCNCTAPLDTIADDLIRLGSDKG